jgi:hypothetical protein
MRRRQRVTSSGACRPQSERLPRRQRWTFTLMGQMLASHRIAVVIANWGEDR